MMQALTPLVEPISIDEAFLDLAGTELLHRKPPALVLAGFARDVERQIGITVSVGLSYCKFLAKVASDMMKPRGFSVIGEAEALEFLAAQPVTLIWGVGKVFAVDARKRRHPHDRPVAAHGAQRSDAPLRHDGHPALPSVARPGRARGAAGPGHQERVGRDDLRRRSRLQRRPRAGAARAFRKGLGAAEEGRHRRPHRRAQAEDPGFQDPHAQPPARRSRPGWPTASSRPGCICSSARPTAPTIACSASASATSATTTRPTRPTLSTSSRASARWPKAPSIRCARSSARKAVETGYTFGKGRSAHPPEPLDD